MDRTARIQALLNGAAANGDVPGVAVAAMLPDGEIVTAAAGIRDAGTDAKMAPDTVVLLASMTKAVTAAAAMQLVEQGKLELDAPIARVLPELGSVQVLEGFDTTGKSKLRPARDAVTLRHLLTHTAGFVYHIWNPNMLRYLEATSTPDVFTCKNAALRLPLVFDPGSAWDYGIGIDWAGKAVEAVSGMRLGRYLEQNLLGPLGMRDTAFRIGAAQRARLARIHTRSNGGFATTDIELPQEPEFDMGGGGLYGTVGDYLRFTRMILGNGALDGVRVLKPETVATMSTNAMGSLTCVPLKTAVAGLSGDVDFIAGMKWGLSFIINPTALPTGRSAGSLAWAGIANSFFWIDPARRVAGVYATQLLPFVDARALDLFVRFETETYAMA
jgi:CubicO group peptidase (beta-lactamase class C family)